MRERELVPVVMVIGLIGVAIIGSFFYEADSTNTQLSGWEKNLPKEAVITDYQSYRYNEWITFKYKGQCILMYDSHRRNSMVNVDNKLCKEK